jgi:hypothetical protein
MAHGACKERETTRDEDLDQKSWEKPSITTATLFSEQMRESRAPSAPHSGFALDSLICSEATVAIAIDGTK